MRCDDTVTSSSRDAGSTECLAASDFDSLPFTLQAKHDQDQLAVLPRRVSSPGSLKLSW